jgi:hypothetical protein
MASYEPHKMLSLKIAGLSRPDQKWILKQLPRESQEKIKASLKFVHKFNAANPQELAEQLIKDKEQQEKVELPPEEPPAGAFSHALEQHIALVQKDQVDLASSARAFVDSVAQGTNDASY